MNSDIITIGSAVKDIFIVSDEFEIIRSSKFEGGFGECVSLGSKIEIDEIYFSSGGGGTNSASTFSKLGFKTACITRIGDDDNGESITKELKSLKINTSLIKSVKNGTTGYSTLLTTHNGERSVLIFRGVAGEFTPQDIVTSKLNSEWIYLTSLGNSPKALAKIFTHLERSKQKLVWNPGRHELNSKPSLLKKYIDLTHVLMVNKEEAEMILGGSSKATIVAMLHALQSNKDQIIVITDGANGTHTLQGDSIYHSGTRPIESISRTGAGDAFGSGMIASIMAGYDLPTAMRIGTINAESVIQSFGAKQGQLKRFPSPQLISKIPISQL